MTTTTPTIFETLLYARHYMLDMIADLSVEQLNKIPDGFRNNIIWNLTHVIAVQQGMCYARSGVTPLVSEDLIKKYNNDTFPENFVDETAVENIKSLAVSHIEQLREDYNKDVFSGFQPFVISKRNIPLNNIDEALAFLAYHEGTHLGYIQALKRLVA
jgi:hypothetical protein